jgi:hypothetical protein
MAQSDCVHDIEMFFIKASGNPPNKQVKNNNPSRDCEKIVFSNGSNEKNSVFSHIFNIPVKMVVVNINIAGTLDANPLGAMVPNVCAVIGDATHQAHAPVIHISATNLMDSFFILPLWSTGPSSLHWIFGRRIKSDETTKKVSWNAVVSAPLG